MRFSKDELDEKIKEVEGYIESAKRELTTYAVATPRDIIAEKKRRRLYSESN